MGSREKGKEEMGTRGLGRVIYWGLEGQEKLTEAEAAWTPDRVLAPALPFTPV